MQVKFYATLRDLTGTASMDPGVESAETVGEVLQRLCALYPALNAKLWHEEGGASGQVTVLLNGRSIQYLDGLATPVAATDIIALFPPIGGGEGPLPSGLVAPE